MTPSLWQGRRGKQRQAILGNQLPANIDLPWTEIAQIRYHQQISQIPWGDSASVAKAKILSWVQRGHDNSRYRRQPTFHRLTNDIVEVTVTQQVAGCPVV